MKQLRLDIAGELVIDNFAGGGGASTGIEMALGRRVDIAINHDPQAVAMHQANHPETRHFCESVWEVNPREVTQGRPVGLVWLSPDCKHFSKAKGGKPVEKKIRGLAWIALRWAATVHPRVIMLENVEEFVTWGPLVADANGGMRPCPKRKGREFNSFVNALRRHGYHVEWKELRASDYGTPTIRKRLFLIARRDGLPIVWPEATHGDPKRAETKARKLKPWRTAAECIDWSVPCPSIFERKRPLADATCRRIAKGIHRYVLESSSPFIVTAAHGEVSKNGAKRWGQGHRSIDLPLPTVTASGGYGVVAPTLIETGYGERPGQAPRAPGLDKPLGTVVAGGQKHALVSAFMLKNYTGVVGHDIRDPLHTVTSVDHHSLVTAHIQRDFGQSIGSPADSPLGTVTAGGGGKASLVQAFLLKYYGTDQDPRLDEPLHTVTTIDRYAVVTVDGVECVIVDSAEYFIADIGMRMLTPRELFRAQGFPESYIIEYGITPDGQRIELPKTAQVRMCGNSVCPPLAAALVRANYTEEQRDLIAA